MDAEFDSDVRIEIGATDEEAEATAATQTGGGETTIYAHLRRIAANFPDRTAFADPPNRDVYGLGPANALSFSEVDRLSDEVAARFIAHGLEDGDTVAMQLPNMRETLVLMLAAWKARLVVVPIPMSWRLNELHHAFAQLDPAAIITIGIFAGEDHASTMREAAAHHLTIRYIFGLGDDLCDGVTPISDWLNTPGLVAPATGDASSSQPPASQGPAVMTWASSANGPYPVPRTHSELLTLARIAKDALKLAETDVVLSTYPVTGIAALCSLFLGPLLAGATIHLHQPFDYDTFVAQLRGAGITYTAAPATVADALARRGDLAREKLSLTRIGRIRPWPHTIMGEAAGGGMSVPVYDIDNLAELALVIRPADEESANAGLPLGKWTGRGDDNGGEVELETRVRGSVTNGEGHRHLHGTLLVRGAMVPAGPFTPAGALTSTMLIKDAQGYIDTRIHCTVDEAVAKQLRCEPDRELIYHGGTAIGASELDNLYADYPDFLDAAVFAIDDDIMGERIFAAVVPRPDKAPSLADFKRFLHEKGIADYKAPDQLVLVNSIPRDGSGAIMRQQILNQVG